MDIFSKMIATALNIAVHQVENTLSLLNGGATIPFISRYRKEATDGLNQGTLRQALRNGQAKGNHP